MAPEKTRPMRASSMPKLSIIGVVSGPIGSLSALCGRMKQKNVPTTNQG
jgi:hypothetical protein